MIEKFELDDLLKQVFKAEKTPKLSAEEQAKKKEKAKEKKANQLSFSDKMRLGPEYLKRFKVDLDELWTSVDTNGDNFLDKTEARNFMEKLGQNVKPEDKGTLTMDNFDKQFNLYDEDKNGFLEKAEMCVFIKKMFKKEKKK